MGEIDGDGGAGGIRGGDEGGEPDAGGESERAAERGVRAEGDGFVRRLGMRVRGDGDNEISLELPNGSRIVGLPGSEETVRGFSAVTLLLVDEAARVSDELYLAVRPMLAVSAGTLWLMSTPNGKRGFFYETWTKGGTEWERIRVPAEECGRIERKHLEEERRAMGERGYLQEYGCEFGDAVGGVFDHDLVLKAITSEVEPLVIP